MKSRTCFNIYDKGRRIIECNNCRIVDNHIIIVANDMLNDKIDLYITDKENNIFIDSFDVSGGLINIDIDKVLVQLEAGKEYYFMTFDSNEKKYFFVNKDIELKTEYISEAYNKTDLLLFFFEIDNITYGIYYGTDGTLRICGEICSEFFKRFLRNEIIYKDDSIFIIKCRKIGSGYEFAVNEDKVDFLEKSEDDFFDYYTFDISLISSLITLLTLNGRKYSVEYTEVDKSINIYKIKGNRKEITFNILYEKDADKIDKICLARHDDAWRDNYAIECSLNKDNDSNILTCKADISKINNKGGRWLLIAFTKDGKGSIGRVYNANLCAAVGGTFAGRNIKFYVENNLMYIEKGIERNALIPKNVCDTDYDHINCSSTVSPKGEMDAKFVNTESGLYIKFRQELRDVSRIKFVLFNTGKWGVIAEQEVELEDKVVRLPDFTNNYLSKIDRPVNDLWMRIAVAVETYDGNTYFVTLKDFKKKINVFQYGKITDYRSLFYNPIGNMEIQGKKMFVVPYYSQAATLSYRYIKEELLYRPQFTNEILDVKIKHNKLYVKLKCRIYAKVKYTGIALEYRKVKEDDAEIYFIPYKKMVEKNNHYIMTAVVDLKEYYLRMLYWDIRCAFTVGDNAYTVTVHTNNDKLLNKYYKARIDRTYPNNDSILFPYATGNNSIALMHRESTKCDHFAFRAKEKLAMLIYNVFKNHYDKKEIYLVFEKYCTMAQDNGVYFFDYCMNSDEVMNSGKDIYYVLEKNAADYKNVAKYKNRVIKFLSLKHMIYLLACKLMISTDTKGHAYVWRSMGSRIKQISYKKPLCFLQHGVTAFKRGHFEKNTNVGCEMFITTSDFEHDIIRDNLGYTDDEIPVTGFARWDVLKDKSAGNKEILMMPTWRTWLDDAENDVFAKSDYCVNYMQLLNNPSLDDILKKNGVTLNFYLHPKFRKYISEFSVLSDNIRLISFGEEQLNELMMKCNMFITDFSSVAWDIYYTGKPVLFYHFDIDTAANTLGFYMDMKNDLYGDIAVTPDELLSLIEEYIGNGMKIKDEYLIRRDFYFKYIDDNNSERIWKAIISKEW